MRAIQPYFVTATSKFNKCVYMRDGIAHFYDYRKDAKEQEPVIAVPDGCVDVFFEKSEDSFSGCVAGSVLQQREIENENNKNYFGVRFLPGVIPAGLKVPIKDLIEVDVPVEELLSRECIKKMSDTFKRKEMIQFFLEDYYKNLEKREHEKGYHPQQELVEYLKRRFEQTGGMVTVAELAEETCYSTRYIHKCFVDYVGIAPKIYGKILKFQKAIQTINQNKDVSFTDLCMETGYYDQSHFNKDFKKFAAVSPKEYKKLIVEKDYQRRMEVRNVQEMNVG